MLPWLINTKSFQSQYRYWYYQKKRTHTRSENNGNKGIPRMTIVYQCKEKTYSELSRCTRLVEWYKEKTTIKQTHIPHPIQATLTLGSSFAASLPVPLSLTHEVKPSSCWISSMCLPGLAGHDWHNSSTISGMIPWNCGSVKLIPLFSSPVQLLHLHPLC